MSNDSTYAYCAQCGFGIEVNRRVEKGVSADFIYRQGDLSWCYYCYQIRKPRTIPQLKSLLAESEVLLASARRLSNDIAIRFYLNNVEKCRAALGLEAAEAKPQGSLF